MKTKIIAIVFLVMGFLGGMIFTGAALNISARYLMLTEMKSPYDYQKTVEMIQDRINHQPGWHLVEVTDENKEVTEHGGKPIGKFTIIKFCNGFYASQMLGADDRKRMGAMLPKSFAVYEKSDGQVYVATANGAIMGKLFGGETERIIEKVNLEVEDIMRFMNFKFSVF